MKALVTGDWHGDKTTMGVSRFAEIERAAEQSLRHAIASGCDAYIFLGDIADPDTGGEAFKSINLLGRVLIAAADAGMNAIAIAGNHCVWNDGSGASCLTPLVGLEALSDRLRGSISIVEKPRVVDHDENHAIACLPYTAIACAYDPDAELAQMDAEIRASKRQSIVAAHLIIPGVVQGEETTDMPRGRDVLFPLGIGKPVARFNGHYHTRQSFDPSDGLPPILIPGAVARLTYNDEARNPAVLIVEIQA